jgi:hypothetical protein
MTWFLSLFRRKRRWVPLHARPWKPASYKVVAWHIEAATRYSELSK